MISKSRNHPTARIQKIKGEERQKQRIEYHEGRVAGVVGENRIYPGGKPGDMYSVSIETNEAPEPGVRRETATPRTKQALISIMVPEKKARGKRGKHQVGK